MDECPCCEDPLSVHVEVIRDGQRRYKCPSEKPDWTEPDLDRRFHLTDRPTGGPAEPDGEDSFYE